MRYALFLALLLTLTASAYPADFTKDVEPVFAKRCVMCHGAAQQQSGLRLDNAADAAKGGYSGPVIVAGQSAASKLLERVTSTKDGFRMPPIGAPLSPAEVAGLKAWVEEGAKWPQGVTIGKAIGRKKSSHWAFQPLAPGTLPTVKNTTWPRNSIDRYVLAKLEASSFAPSPEADRQTLLRRASLDLTGIPPSLELQREFQADNSPQAYERAVDKLLASRHYGERWARQWLDLARYADSDGYEKDLVRPYAWRWRNYVIDSFNANKPFDQFTIEQLAGDLLPQATLEQKIATGFHRNTLINREAGVSRAEDRFETLVNRTNTTATTWMGLTVGCAQCHDHKYDPISQREHYSLMAFFSKSQDVEIDAPLPGELGPWLASRADYEKKRQAILAEAPIAQWQTDWEKNMRAAITKPGEQIEWDFSVTSFRVMFDNAEKVMMANAEQRSPRDAWRLTRYFIANPGPVFNRNKENGDLLKAVRKKIDDLEAATPQLGQVSAIAPDPDAAPQRIAVRGDWKQPGITVDPAPLAVLPEFKANGEPERLAFARWLVSKENPLTPRVIVNRYWQEFFGRGIVKTSEDFGTQGDKPSHPELLDWLARDFSDNGWDLKRLHRQIVLSATYRQSSKARADVAAIDADNSLLARQSRLRLSAEGIRDTALAVSGLLSTNIGGPSVRPPQPKGVAEITYGGSKWKESEGADRYRRGLYVHFQRTSPYPMLMNFDTPDMNVACSRRRSSDTPLQALNLLNDPVFYEAAQALGYRVRSEGPADLEGRIQFAFALAVGRPASPREVARLKTYIDNQNGEAAWTGLGRVLLNLDEFIVRE
jgi:hypothetical protein